MSKLAIVLVGYNRAEPMKDLLVSLNNIKTEREDIQLVISIDNKGTVDVNKLANDYIWRHGKKTVIIHEEKLGLKNHFIWAGDQTEEYENVLFLEDDLYVSPYIIEFVEAYLKKYADDNRIAAASLYNPILCEFTKCKFYQIQDGYDNYFLQHPYWGNVWCRSKWREFKKWFIGYKYNERILPSNVRAWGEHSFKKVYIQYLIETNRYVVYPRISYITNMGVKGLHNKYNAIQFQVVLEGGHRELRLSSLDESDAVYDAFFEVCPNIIKKHVEELNKYDLCIDLNGMKDKVTSEYVITRRKVKKAIQSFDASMRPNELNILMNNKGVEFSLALSKDIIMDTRKKIYAEERSTEDILRNYPVRSKHLLFAMLYSIKKALSKN